MTSGAEILRQRKAAREAEAAKVAAANAEAAKKAAANAEAAKQAEAVRIAAEAARVIKEAEDVRVAKEAEDARIAEIAKQAAVEAEALKAQPVNNAPPPVAITEDTQPTKEIITGNSLDDLRKRKAAAEAEAARIADAINVETARIAKEAETARLAEIAKQTATEAETARIAKVAEDARIAKEAETARLAEIAKQTAAEAEAAKIAKAAEDARIAKEAETARLAEIAKQTAAEAETARVAKAAEDARIAKEAETARLAEIAKQTAAEAEALKAQPPATPINKSDNNILAQDDRYFLVDKKSLEVKWSVDEKDVWKKAGYIYGVLDNDIYSDRSSKEKLKVAEDNLTTKLVDNVQNGRLDFNRDDGTFKYTPNKGFSGEDQFTYQVCKSSSCSNIATATIIMKNYAPKVKDDTYTMREDNVLNLNTAEGVFAKTGLIIYGVLNNDQDRNKNKLSAELVSDVKHGKLEFNKDGTFKYTPNKGYFGMDEFSYKAWDGIEYSSTAKARITIERNNPPQAVDDQYKMKQGTILNADRVKDTTGFGYKVATYGVLSNDVDSNKDPLTASVVKKPEHGKLSFKDDGTFTYEPDNNYYGDDYFTYMASDGILQSSTATAYIIIQSSNTEL